MAVVERLCASVAERALPVRPAMGDEFAVPLGHRTGGHSCLRGCLGFLENLVRCGERHIAQDACWPAITFTYLRVAAAWAVATNHWHGIGHGAR